MDKRELGIGMCHSQGGEEDPEVGDMLIHGPRVERERDGFG